VINLTIKYTAGINGSISITVVDEFGVPQNLTGFTVVLNLVYTNEDDALISKTMTVNESVCSLELSATDTEILSRGEYEIQLVLKDGIGKIFATERQPISINKVTKGLPI
jgi:uncharacterized protein (DUF2344 family)